MMDCFLNQNKHALRQVLSLALCQGVTAAGRALSKTKVYYPEKESQPPGWLLESVR